MEDRIYVIGHRNPDADAICSAIGYAAYKQATGHPAYEAARCGNSNARIDSILDRFHIPLPRFVGDVTPRVRDIMSTDLKLVRTDSICAEALELIDHYDVRSLPVVGSDDRLKGVLTVFDLGGYFIPKPLSPRSMRHVVTSINDIVRAVNGRIIHAVEPDRQEDFFVRIGAMDIRSFGRSYQDDRELAKHSAIIVGDRYDIQQRSIQLGVRLIAITGDLPVDDDVVELARERGVSIISTPADSATTSWLMRSAMRVEQVMKTEIAKFSPDDRVATVRQRVTNLAIPTYMVVDEEDNLVGVFTRTDLLKRSRTSLVLVDHNELSQAVPGAEHVRIHEIIDHHRLGNPPTEQPILFVNRPVGSTSTIVAEMFHRDGVEPTPEIAGILMGGMISDTLNLQGPTTTAIDEKHLRWLENIAGISADALAETIFSAGSIILTETPESVIRSDMKEYTEGSQRFSVSQVEELGYANFKKHQRALRKALAAVRAAEGYDFSALLVTDINTQNSLLLVDGESELTDLIKYPNSPTGAFELNGIVSRKKQLLPYLTGLLRNVNGAPVEETDTVEA
ncbi:MAG: putative manganese-dependent inorganic diphosphatase [Opitutales bacterium]